MNTLSPLAPLATSRSKPSITREAAAALIDAVRVGAAEIGIEVAIAVTDAGGHLIAFERTDDAPFLTVDVAIDKAWTAASYGLGTNVWNSYLADPHVAPLAHVRRLVAVGGGCPIKEGDALVGGIGVSGGTYQQDQDIAEAALRSVGLG